MVGIEALIGLVRYTAWTTATCWARPTAHGDGFQHRSLSRWRSVDISPLFRPGSPQALHEKCSRGDFRSLATYTRCHNRQTYCRLPRIDWVPQ